MFTTSEEKVPDNTQVENVKIIHIPPAVTNRSRWTFSSPVSSSYLQNKRGDVKAATEYSLITSDIQKSRNGIIPQHFKCSNVLSSGVAIYRYDISV